MCCNVHEQTPNIKGTVDGNSSQSINILSCKLLTKYDITQKNIEIRKKGSRIIQIVMKQCSNMLLCFNVENNRNIFE